MISHSIQYSFKPIAGILAIILYNQPTREIGLKSTNNSRLSHLAIREMKEELISLGKTPFLCNSLENLITSTFMVSQNSLIKRKMKPSRPRLLSLPQFQITYFTSSSFKIHYEHQIVTTWNLWKLTPSNFGLLFISSTYLLSKYLFTSPSINTVSSHPSLLHTQTFHQMVSM